MKTNISSISKVWVGCLFATLLTIVIQRATSAQTFLYSGTETNITLGPGTYDITAYGAQGGPGGWCNGGPGTEMEGEFRFTTVVRLTILVGGSGQAGGYYPNSNQYPPPTYIGGGGGGGGGSFVVNGSTPLVVAGGGGGGGINANGGSGATGSGGGSGGSGVGYSGGGGGGGFSSAGGAGLIGSSPGGGGGSFLSGGGGGSGGELTFYGGGGLGGGGGGGGLGGGGGGGYSGGNGGSIYGGGSGGGSYIDSTAITNLVEVSGAASPDDSPNGEIIITAVPFQITAVTPTSGNSLLITWNTTGISNIVQVGSGSPPNGSFSTNYFTDLTNIVVTTPTTNFLDMSAATNRPTRYYRIRSPQ